MIANAIAVADEHDGPQRHEGVQLLVGLPDVSTELVQRGHRPYALRGSQLLDGHARGT